MSDINNNNSNKEAEALLGAVSYQSAKKTVADIAVDDVSNNNNQRSRFKSWTILGTSILLLAAAGHYTGSSNGSQTSLLRSGNFCLDTLTSLLQSRAIGPIQESIRSMDPIEVGDKQEREFPNAQLPGGCTDSATAWVEMGSISGLDTTDLDIDLQPGGSCNLIRQRVRATWRLASELTTLNTAVRAGIKSDACGKPIDLTASGTASIPMAYLNGDVYVEARVTGFPLNIGGQVSDVRIERLDFDIPSIDANFLVTSPLKDYEFKGVMENFIKEEFRTLVAGRVKSFVNENIGDRLPITFP